MGKTAAHLLGLGIPNHGTLADHVLTEAVPKGAMPEIRQETLRPKLDAAGQMTIVLMQSVGAPTISMRRDTPGGRWNCRRKLPPADAERRRVIARIARDRAPCPGRQRWSAWRRRAERDTLRVRAPGGQAPAL